MGNRALYHIIEDGQSSYFYAHMGANALSPLLRLTQAKALQGQLPEQPSIANIFAHLDYGGQYQNPRLMDADMFCEPLDENAVSSYQTSYSKRSELEMRVTLDLDSNSCLLEYNPNCPWYRTMGDFSIPLTNGLNNVGKLLEYADGKDIHDFGMLLSVYHRSTGLDSLLEQSRGTMRMEEYLNSPKAEEDRQRYFRLYGHQEGLGEEDNEEMEEL